MVAELARERAFRGPGCDHRCHVVHALLPGLFGRTDLLIHDPEVHEEYGRRQVSGPPPDVVITGPLAVGIETLETRVGGQVVNLSPTEIKILRALARRIGHGVSTEVLLEEVWHRDWLLTMRASSHMVRTNVSRLRTKLGRAGTLITTVWGLGYRLEMLPVAERPSETADIARPEPAERRWAKDWDRCRRCQRDTLSHYGHGYCGTCYKRLRERGELPDGAS